MPTYTFRLSADDAGYPVTVKNAAGSTVASGTLDSNARFTADLPVGDYVGTSTSGRYPQSSAGEVDRGDLDGVSTTALSATFAAGVSLPASNGTDDTSAINAILSAHAGKRISGAPGQTYKISGPIVGRGGGTVIDLTGCTIQSTSTKNLFENASAASARSVKDSGITAGAAVLTSATAAFVAGDVGTPVMVWGAGQGGHALRTTIASVTNGTTAVLAVNAVTTVVGQAACIGTRDSGITLIGGTWDRGTNASGVQREAHLIAFRRADKITVRDVKMRSGAGKYAINFGDCTDFTVDTADFNTWSDGVHVNGPATRGVIRNISGTTGDDTVSLTPNDYTNAEDVAGDITDINIEDIHPGLVGVGAGTSATFAGLPVKVLGGLGRVCSKIRVKRVSGLINSAYAGVWIGDDTGEPRTSGGLVDDVTVEDVNTIGPAGNFAQVYMLGTNIKRVRVRGVHVSGTSTSGGAVWVNGSGTVVESLHIDGVTYADGLSGFPVLRVDATCKKAIVRNVSGTTIGYVVQLQSGATVVNKLIIDGITADSCSGLIQASTAGTTMPVVQISNVQTAAGGNWGVGDVATTTDYYLSNINTTPGVSIFNLRATAVARVWAQNVNFNGKNIQGNAGYTIASKAFGLPIDVSMLNSKTKGDAAYNTNAALACGVGQVVYTGTAWKSLLDGTTY